MSSSCIVIATNRKYNQFIANSLANELSARVILISEEADLTCQNLSSINPDWVFVLHWSRIIPEEVYTNFRVVIFHMTDLPFGRGGSPLQNLILRGYEDTVISAIQCVKEIDAGSVYLKERLNLNGTADEILIRASKIIKKMIVKIVQENPTPFPQVGEVSVFKRRQPHQSKIDFHEVRTLEQFYDYIRMLDGEGYPNAFVEVGNFRISFHSPHLRPSFVESQVKIELIHESEDDSQ